MQARGTLELARRTALSRVFQDERRPRFALAAQETSSAGTPTTTGRSSSKRSSAMSAASVSLLSSAPGRPSRAIRPVGLKGREPDHNNDASRQLACGLGPLPMPLERSGGNLDRDPTIEAIVARTPQAAARPSAHRLLSRYWPPSKLSRNPSIDRPVIAVLRGRPHPVRPERLSEGSPRRDGPAADVRRGYAGVLARRRRKAAAPIARW